MEPRNTTPRTAREGMRDAWYTKIHQSRLRPVEPPRSPGRRAGRRDADLGQRGVDRLEVVPGELLLARIAQQIRRVERRHQRDPLVGPEVPAQPADRRIVAQQ